MSQTAIEKLTPGQETLIPIYFKKWKELVFSTEAIDRERVKSAYAIMGYEEPKVIFCDSPYAAFMTLLDQGLGVLGVEPRYHLSSPL